MRIFYLLLFYLITPYLAYSIIGSNYFIDINDINSIDLGMSYNDVSSKIGSPVQIENKKINDGNSISVYKYRVKEYGYNFRRFIKPDNIKISNWIDSSYLVNFNFQNKKLISISRTDNKGIDSSLIYFDPSKFDIKAFAAGELKPLWIDLRDIHKIKIGMTENEIIKLIGPPSQLLNWEKKNSKETKNVFYRVREILSLSKKKEKFQLDNSINNFIKLKGRSNEDDKVLIDPSSIRIVNNIFYYKTNGQSKQTNLKLVEELVINGKKSKIEKDLEINGGVWSHYSHNVILKFENQKLIKIEKQ